MSLIQKLASAAQRAANQANGRQSQGPVTAQGLQNSRTARLRHGLYAEFFEETMDALGEDLGGFAELQEALVRYWQPRDAFRATLVKRLARLMWQMERADCQQESIAVARLQSAEAENARQARLWEGRHRGMTAEIELLLGAVKRRDLSYLESEIKVWRAIEEKPNAWEAQVTVSLELLLNPSTSDEDRQKAYARLEELLSGAIAHETADYEAYQREMPAKATLRLSEELERPSAPLGRKAESLSRQIERTIKLLRDLKAEDERAAPAGPGGEAGQESAKGENEG